VKNLRRAVRELDVDVSEEELQKMVELVDLDRDGRVSEEEFFAFMTGKEWFFCNNFWWIFVLKEYKKRCCEFFIKRWKDSR
jgi:hypothetical protein